jgi:hypothetical protein
MGYLVSYFQPIVSLGETYDLSHLEPFKMEFDSVGARKTLTINVTFSNHCFSKKLSDEPTSQHVTIENTSGPKTRVFCPIRYRLSKDIPLTDIIKKMNNSAVKVFQTKSRRNWCYSIQIDDPKGPYHVFFEMRKNQNNQRKSQDLNMVVESAYHQTEEPPKLLGRMGFQMLCTNVYLNKKLATKR